MLKVRIEAQISSLADTRVLSSGVWLSETTDSSYRPFGTFIGSSNLSTRSLKLDVELSNMILTTSKSLSKALSSEINNLRTHVHRVGAETWRLPERRVSWQARALVALGVENML